MSTVTAHCMVGTAHPNHGGIIPTHTIYLNENSHPVLTLLPQNLPPRRRRVPLPVVWIPRPDKILETLIVMAYLFVIRHPEVRLGTHPRLLEEAFEPIWLPELEKDHPLDPLFDLCRRAETNAKLQLTASTASTLYHQLPILTEHIVDVEVCVPVFRREFSQWRGQNHTVGEIPSLESRTQGI